MPINNKAKVALTENEVRLMFAIALATGKSIVELKSGIIGALAECETTTDTKTGERKVVPGSSKFAKMLDELRKIGYMD